MTRNHPRIAIVEDEELAASLADVTPFVEAGMSKARLVRDLAIRGAEDMLREERERREALEWLAWWSTSEDGMDHEALAEVIAMRERDLLDSR